MLSALYSDTGNKTSAKNIECIITVSYIQIPSNCKRSLKTLYCMNLSINHFIKAEFLLLKSYFLPIKDAYGTYSMTLSAVQRDHVECFLVVLKSCFALGVIKFILSHQCHKLEQFFQTVGFKDI